MPLHWLCYRHNNQVSVVIEPGAIILPFPELPKRYKSMIATWVGACCADLHSSQRLAFGLVGTDKYVETSVGIASGPYQRGRHALAAASIFGCIAVSHVFWSFFASDLRSLIEILSAKLEE
jgi:hypothetical protein